MRFTSASAVAVLSLLSGVSAVISGITVPIKIAAGKPFNITLNTADYIQRVEDVATAFGISYGGGNLQSLGSQLIASEYLGPSKSNILTPIHFTVSLDADTAPGVYMLNAAVFSLWGVLYSPGTVYHIVTVEVGSETSNTTISSSL